MWHAHIEHVSAVLRVFSNDKSYGDPYEFACTLRWIDSKTVEMIGVDKSPLPSMYHCVFDVLHSEGVEKLIFVRKGKVREVDLVHYAKKRDEKCLKEKTQSQELE